MTGAVVVDASVALAWCFADEASPETDKLFELLRDEGGIVPGLWHLELSNVLLLAERRGRMSTSAVIAQLDIIATWPIATDQETTQRAWREILTLARTEGLTSYDAAYLELALRRGLPLLTKDHDLASAAQRLGIAVLPEPKGDGRPRPSGRRRRPA